jgi:hypothetical protein
MTSYIKVKFKVGEDWRDVWLMEESIVPNILSKIASIMGADEFKVLQLEADGPEEVKDARNIDSCMP